MIIIIFISSIQLIIKIYTFHALSVFYCIINALLLRGCFAFLVEYEDYNLSEIESTPLGWDGYIL